jgi:hypothetical protein
MYRKAFTLIYQNVALARGWCVDGSVKISIFYLSQRAKTLETFA